MSQPPLVETVNNQFAFLWEMAVAIMVRNVLLLGKDSGLLATRADLLMVAWMVSTAIPSSFTEALLATPFDLLVFCHSLSLLEVETAATQFRSHNPASPLLWLQEYPQHLDTIGKYTILRSPVYPLFLIGTIDKLLPKDETPA